MMGTSSLPLCGCCATVFTSSSRQPAGVMRIHITAPSRGVFWLPAIISASRTGLVATAATCKRWARTECRVPGAETLQPARRLFLIYYASAAYTATDLTPMTQVAVAAGRRHWPRHRDFCDVSARSCEALLAKRRGDQALCCSQVLMWTADRIRTGAQSTRSSGVF